MQIAYLSYQPPKKGRCSLCNARKLLSTLVLFHDQKQIYGDLIVCEDCRNVLESALLDSGSYVEQQWDFKIKEG